MRLVADSCVRTHRRDRDGEPPTEAYVVIKVNVDGDRAAHGMP